MKRALLGVLCFAACLGPAVAQTQPVLVHHAVSTSVPDAQRYFDEGLSLVYAFNRPEAQKRFRLAATADSKLGMAWWGVALAAGPNLNFDMEASDWKTVASALEKAKALVSGASPEERRYIAALSERYPAAAKLPNATGYRDAMAAVHRDFPQDDDAATLYVESVMDAEDWGFDDSGKSIGSTAALDTILEAVMVHNPQHPGANHYYTHLNDFASTAPKALVQAGRLSALPTEPAASHLKHMSGHIYFDVGNYAGLQHDNRLAVEADRTYAASIEKAPASLEYYFHNLDFYAGGSLMLGDRTEADRAATFFDEAGDSSVLLVWDREQRFADVLAYAPASKARSRHEVTLHYARGIAFASLHDLAGAQRELRALGTASAGLTGYLANFAHRDSMLLGARVAYLRGDGPAAVTQLRDLISRTANLPPEAYPAWYYPMGEWLGWMLLQNGDPAGAQAAFGADLVRTPHNPRALFGLMEALSDDDQTIQARALVPQIISIWRGRPQELRDQL